MSFTPIKNDDFKKGVVLKEEQFKIPDNAFSRMRNAYPFRDRVLSRKGNRFLGKLRRCLTGESLTAAPASGTTYNENVKTDLSLESGSSLELSSITITISTLITVEDDGDGTLSKTAGTADLDEAASFINYATGEVNIELSSGTYSSEAVLIDVCYFPSLPVMGLHTYEQPEINREITLAFDTTYCYTYNTSTTQFEEFIPGTTWSGSNSDFFNGVNYFVDSSNNNLFWTTNFSGTTGDPIRYTNGTTWTDFAPAINGSGDELHQYLLLVPFRGILLAMNTYEGASLASSINYKNRIRGSQIGSPLQTDAWRDDIAGKGFSLDLPTNEAIIGFEFIRDELAVFTERGSWTITFTADSSQPIYEKRQNTDLGIGSTYSMINFDDRVVGIGQNYIIQSNGIETTPINDDIPDFAYTIHNQNSGRKRVQGIRNYQDRLAFWTYPDASENGTYPNTVLVWNYIDNAWSFFRDNITAFGNYQQFTDITWAEVDWTWADWTTTWSAGAQQSQFLDIIGGNQKGYVMLMNKQQIDDVSMPIDDISLSGEQVLVTITDHNLQDREFVYLQDILGDFDDINDATYQIEVIDSDTFLLFKLDTDDETIVPLTHASGDYLGGGQIRLIGRFDILSKKFNLIDKGKKILLAYIDLLLNVDNEAKFNLNVYKDYKNADPLVRSFFWMQTINPTLTTKDTPNSDKVFKKYYVGTIADFVQYQFTINDINMFNIYPGADFELHSIVLHVRPTGKLTV